MKEFKGPNLTAPRFRATTLAFDNAKTLEEFKVKYPHHSDLELQTFCNIIKTFNGMLWQTVIDYRDGIELPESLGHIFIGTCSAPKKINIDYKASAEHGFKVQNRNWETDNKLAKIFYTNYYQKYRFANRDLWNFQAVRQFKRAVAKDYPEQYQKYIVMSRDSRISHLYDQTKFMYKEPKQTESDLQNYDEFKID